MGYYTTAEIVKIVNRLIDRCGTRNPYRVAKELGINIIYRNFDKQRGAYKVILKNRCEKTVWSMKQISLLLRLRCLMTPFWSTLKTATTFSKLHEQ